MTLHLLGLPHTYTHPKFSCCAFTGKVLRFSPMMRSVGYSVIHYGNAGSESGANEQVTILNRKEFADLGGCEIGPEQYGARAVTSSPIYEAFNARLATALAERVEAGDIICLPFGTAHSAALADPRLNRAYFVETGIGYRHSFAPFRIFESAAWMYCHLGSECPGTILGRDYWFVIPNYYEPSDWPLAEQPLPSTVAFLGRLNEDKGLQIILELAKRRPSVDFLICGQGDPSQWTQAPNIRALPPIHGQGRAAYLGSASAVIVPTRYVEPFGGVAAEALLTGTPVIASAFGAFPEYVRHGENGWLCRTLADWLFAVDCATCNGATFWCRRRIQNEARNRFGVAAVARQYDRAFKQITNLSAGGWYHNT